MIPVCKHPKTITIVADNHRFAPVCVSVYESVCRRGFCTRVGVEVHKHTHTFQGNVLEIPEPLRMAALFLLLN